MAKNKSGKVRQNDTIPPIPDKSGIDPKEERQKQVLALMLNGHTQEEIAQKLNVSRATIARDCIDIKIGRVKFIQELQKSFSISDFIAQKLQRIEQRRQKCWELLDNADKDGVKVAILKQLSDLDLEEEQTLNKIGLETSKVDPSKIAQRQVFVIHDGAPPELDKSPKKDQ